MPSSLTVRHRSFLHSLLLGIFVASLLSLRLDAQLPQPSRDPIRLTHGPMLGQPASSSMVVWGRTSEPGEFTVHYSTDQVRLEQISQPGTTAIERDNTGTVKLIDLQPETRYHYQVWVDKRPHGLPGSFLTLPSKESSRNDEHNPNMPKKLDEKRLVAFQHPQIVFQYYDGRTGELAYAEAISLDR